MVKGIDLSHWQPNFNYLKAKQDGCGFLIAKISEGVGYKDDLTHKHLAGAKANGMLTGGYHFMRCNLSGEAQAELFLKDLPKFDLPPALDLEEQSRMGVSLDTCKREARAWLKKVEAATKRAPMIYGGSAFLAELNLEGDFAKYPLWVAQYAQHPHIPKPWAKATIWQFTDGKFNPNGNEQKGDTNWFLGSMDELKHLAGV